MRPILRVLAFLSTSAVVPAQAPPGYYSSVDTSTAAALRATLHAVIDDHVKFPYTSGGTDTWVILEQADEDPGNASLILDVYKNASFSKAGGGNSNYNREHTWPNAYGFPNDSGTNYPYSDCHQLFLCDIAYNGARADLPYRACTGGCTEQPTQVNAGAGGGTGVYPGNSNWNSGSGASGAWETWSDRRGDVARAQFYLDLRYEGGFHGISGAAEPDLVLTDDVGLIAASATGQNEGLAYMGILFALLQWHAQDPVDAKELLRNDVVYGYQANRNPFIDHPEWVQLLYAPGPAFPSLSANLSTLDLALGGSQMLTLQAGAANAGRLYFLAGTTEGTVPGFDVGGYHIPLNPIGSYFQLTLAGPGALLVPHLGLLDASGNATAAFNLPGGLSASLAGTTVSHAYVVLSPSFALAGASNAVDVVLSAAPLAPVLVINEIDYDQAGTDTAEYIEIYNAGASPAALANVTLELWNGANDTLYGSVALSQAGVTLAPGAYLVVGTTSVVASLPPGPLSITFASASDNVQNGAPDGMRLVQGTTVLDSLSYEGLMAGLTEGLAGAGTDSSSGLQSLARSPNGADTGANSLDFAIATTLTPGTANP